MEAKYEPVSVGPTDPTEPTDQTKPENPGNVGDTQNPAGSDADQTTNGTVQTGDSTHSLVWAVLAALALGVIVVMVVYRRKRISR